MKVLILLADGFEEIEAISVIDILRRADLELVTVGLTKKEVLSSHQVTVIADSTLSEIDPAGFDLIFLPGGEPGTTNLENSENVKNMLRTFHNQQKWIAAICAAPRILEGLGILQTRKATGYPTIQSRMKTCSFVNESVVQDGHIITSRGPGTAMLMGYTLVEVLKSKAAAKALQEQMLFKN